MFYPKRLGAGHVGLATPFALVDEDQFGHLMQIAAPAVNHFPTFNYMKMS